MRSTRRAVIVALVVLGASASPWAVLFAVNGVMGPTAESYQRQRCTRFCHDHGCPHRPALPATLTGSRGLFGATVGLLHRAGGMTGLGPARGYGAVNILVFCLLWPALMVALVALATWQRLELRALRRSDRG